MKGLVAEPRKHPGNLGREDDGDEGKNGGHKNYLGI